MINKLNTCPLQFEVQFAGLIGLSWAGLDSQVQLYYPTLAYLPLFRRYSYALCRYRCGTSSTGKGTNLKFISIPQNVAWGLRGCLARYIWVWNRAPPEHSFAFFLSPWASLLALIRRVQLCNLTFRLAGYAEGYVTCAGTRQTPTKRTCSTRAGCTHWVSRVFPLDITPCLWILVNLSFYFFDTFGRSAVCWNEWQWRSCVSLKCGWCYSLTIQKVNITRVGRSNRPYGSP